MLWAKVVRGMRCIEKPVMFFSVSFTLKKLLIFIITIILLASLVLYDPRGSIVTEPVGQVKAAISVAISYLVYGIDGFVGLQEVYEILNKIPSISNYTSRYYSHLGGFILDFENILQNLFEYRKNYCSDFAFYLSSFVGIQNRGIVIKEESFS